MKSLLVKIALASFALGAYIGCSPVNFSVDTDPCEKDNSCVVENGKFAYNQTLTVGGGKVDILIVNDNSASMSFEQKNLAARFSGFIQSLDNRNVDYRIAMTTTDIHIPGDGNEPRAINGNGALQNGKLIPFGSHAYLTKSVSNRVSLFNQTVVRPETAQCEQFIANWINANGISSTNTSPQYVSQYKTNCPSGDERGIYAANLAVRNNPSSFIRGDAHLAIIFLSDEDVRSGLYNYSSAYELDDLDQPADLIQNIYSKFGTNKGISVHAITVKTNSCLTQQANQALGNPAVAATKGFVTGTLGTAYQTFPQNGWGKSVDICFSDYTSQLGDISTYILERINSVALKCANPTDLTVELVPAQSSITHQMEGSNLRFSQNLAVGTKVKVSYKCDAVK